MKYMLLLKGDEGTEPAEPAGEEDLNTMGRFNEELMKAGVILAGEGLHGSAEGVRVDYSGDDRTVTDGPFTETKELLAGFWILQVHSKDEAIEWARRVPLRSGQVEVRRIWELEEFDQSNEYVQKEAQWREELGESRTA